MKFGKPRKTTQGIDVENTYAKFGGPTMIGSWSKIGGTKASGEREQQQQQQEQEELILHSKYANCKQS